MFEFKTLSHVKTPIFSTISCAAAFMLLIFADSFIYNFAPDRCSFALNRDPDLGFWKSGDGSRPERGLGVRRWRQRMRSGRRRWNWNWRCLNLDQTWRFHAGQRRCCYQWRSPSPKATLPVDAFLMCLPSWCAIGRDEVWRMIIAMIDQYQDLFYVWLRWVVAFLWRCGELV